MIRFNHRGGGWLARRTTTDILGTWCSRRADDEDRQNRCPTLAALVPTDDPVPDAERHDLDQSHRSTAAQGIRAVSCSTRFPGWTLRGWVAALVCVVGHRDPNPATASCPVIWSVSPMKRCLAAFAITASLFAPVARANDALEAKVRVYVPVVSLAKVCDIRINDATSGDHRAMLKAVKSDPNANKLAYRLHYETQTAYIKARDGGQRVAFCKDFIAARSQYGKARFTAVVEGRMSEVVPVCRKRLPTTSAVLPPSSCPRPTGNRTRKSKRCFRPSKSWPRKTLRLTAGMSPRKRRRSRISSARR